MSFRADQLQVKNTYKTILKLALPISVSIFIPQLNILTNTIFLGNYQPKHFLLSTSEMLAASGVAGIYYLTLVMSCYGLGAGSLMLMSRKAGEKNERGMQQLFAHGVVLSVALSGILMGISYILAPPLFRATLHNASIADSAISFLHIRFWGLPFIAVCQLCNSFFLALSLSRLIIYGSIVQTIVNIGFDYLLIFGNARFPEMGLEGSALASVFADASFFIVSIFIVWQSPALQKARDAVRMHLDKQIIRSIFLKSLPIMIQYFLSIGAWEVFFIFVEHLGKTESALSQIYRSVFGVVGIAAWSLGSTCNSMVSNLIGQQAFAEVLPLIKKIIRVSFLVAFIVGLPVFLFPSYFLALMTADKELVKAGISSLRIVVLATWMLSVSSILFHAVLGIGKTTWNMVFEGIAILFYLLYITIVIEYYRLPLHYAWMSEFVYWFVLFVCSFLYFYLGRWRKDAQQVVPFK